jgi:hypothetical protein
MNDELYSPAVMLDDDHRVDVCTFPRVLYPGEEEAEEK